MPWAFQGIASLTSALEAFQSQIDITGQNISNVDTQGYTRKTVNLTEAPGTPNTYGSTFELGAGVTIESISRIQADYLQTSSLSTSSGLGMANSQAQTTSAVNSVVADPNNTGLSPQISAFFNAWSSLAASPTAATKLAVQQAGQSLASSFSGTYNSLDNIKQGATQQVASLLKQAQSDVNQIAALNNSINKSKIDGSTPNDLLDQRDKAVSDLSSIMNVSVQKSSDGTFSVSSGNLVLVDMNGARTVPTAFDAASGTLSNGSGSFAISSGQIAGLFDSINKVGSYEGSLNTLSNQVTAAVNSVYATASDSNGVTGAQFFNTGTGAQNMSVSAAIAANPDSILFGASGSASDTGVAQAISNIANQAQAGLNNETMGGYYSQLVSQVGVDGQRATSAQSTQQSLQAQVANQIQSVSGVNLDTEMANLLRFQRSYQAAAQALTAMDQTTQTLLSTVK